MNNIRLIGAAVLVTVASISDGMHYGWSAPVGPILLETHSATEEQIQWLETILILGSCCGIPLTMYLVDKIGRKRTLIGASNITLISWFIIAIASNIRYIYVARFLAGMTVSAGFVAAPMYIAEIADHKIRGFLSSFIYLMMLVGVVLVYSIVPFTPFWVPCVVGMCCNAITLSSFLFIPESPYYLQFKNKPEEAKRSLERLRPYQDIDDELNEIQFAIKRQQSERGRPQDLFLVKSNRKALLIMIWVNASQDMSGTTVMIMNLHSILDQAGAVYVSSSTAGIIFSIVMLFSALFASTTIDHFGRKILLISSGIFAGISLGIIAIYFTLKDHGYNVLGVSWIVPAAVLCFAAAFKLGLGLVPIVLVSELFPAKVKAMGITISQVSLVVASVISLQFYYALKLKFGIEVPFYIFACWCFATVLFTLLFIPETKGKTLDEIQYILKDKEREKLLPPKNHRDST